ncbi:ABC transporter ATP-binding protein [Peptoniphilus catoniae]|uniref:ABC transporter ATP-binding protein n=1 Tax=Peptoniphilus catoniae TaxID=1660341 RepID=UPI0015D623FD|nr:oligopeptide/dipeptide ABC transporter ATP-binding protein [Peptoniphilus catoniae]
MENKALLRLEDVVKRFAVKGKKIGEEKTYVHAVNKVSLNIYQGETLGIVGESGCGKTTLGRLMIRLTQPSQGKIIYEDKDISNLSEKEMKPYRKDLQIIFQDPYSSLDPRMTVGDIIAEPFEYQNLYSKKERTERVKELMKLCGLDTIYVRRYPHEFSGGQRQRIGIARALALTPKFMVCDEPVSALDVSIQSQIINLLMDLQEKSNLTYAFISHNLNVIYHISDRVAVMYLGYLMELADKDELYFHSAHPYTKALLASIPNIDFESEPLKAQLKGDIPSAIDQPKGCPFASRCPIVKGDCLLEKPVLKEIAKDHYVACNYPQRL